MSRSLFEESKHEHRSRKLRKLRFALDPDEHLQVGQRDTRLPSILRRRIHLPPPGAAYDPSMRQPKPQPPDCNANCFIRIVAHRFIGGFRVLNHCVTNVAQRESERRFRATTTFSPATSAVAASNACASWVRLLMSCSCCWVWRVLAMSMTINVCSYLSFFVFAFGN